ncbi:MAG: hypothetical protein IKP55_04530 [Clostridia bacterium]|nr:hypothetical protein [Clostridia bacterium]
MITVIDRTLSVLKDPSSPSALRRLADAIFASGADVIEISESNYRILSQENPDGRYLLRLERGSSPASFPGVKRFVSTGSAAGNVVMSEEYIVNGLDLLLSGAVPAVLRPVRLSLSTPALDCSPVTLFSAIRSTFLCHIEFAPHGDSGIATSLCAEWALTDGNMPVTTVSGVGGYASLSDLTVFLRSIRRRRPAEKQLDQAELLEKLREAFPNVQIPESEMKVSPSSSIHLLKFRLEQLGFGGSPAKLKTLSSKIRAGHKTPSPYLDGAAIYAVSRQID